MKLIRHALRSPHARRLVVAVAVAGAGAAVAGAVVMAERPARVAVTAVEVGAAAERFANRSAKDAWRRVPAPWAHQATASAGDPSLPAAADALSAAPDGNDEAPSTF